MRVVVNYGRWSREEMLRAAQQNIAQSPKAWITAGAFVAFILGVLWLVGEFEDARRLSGTPQWVETLEGERDHHVGSVAAAVSGIGVYVAVRVVADPRADDEELRRWNLRGGHPRRWQDHQHPLRLGVRWFIRRLVLFAAGAERYYRGCARGESLPAP